MGQAFFTSNETIKISAAIAATGSYTVPANSYAELNLCLNSVNAFTGYIRVGGKRVFDYTVNQSFSVPGFISNSVPNTSIQRICAGPGQTVDFVTTNGSAVLDISGVLFSNSP